MSSGTQCVIIIHFSHFVLHKGTSDNENDGLPKISARTELLVRLPVLWGWSCSLQVRVTAFTAACSEEALLLTGLSLLSVGGASASAVKSFNNYNSIIDLGDRDRRF